MKKVLLSFVLSALIFSTKINAQIPNGNFETVLSDGTLSNWGNITLFAVIIDSSGNQLVDSIVFDGPFCGISNDANTGNHALEMRNAYDYTANQGISGWASVDEDSVYLAWGSLEFIYTNIQPQNFNFYYKYNSVNGDTGIARLTLYDAMMDPIGESITLFSGSNSTYNYVTVPIYYTSTNSIAAYSLNFNTYYSEADFPVGGSLGTRLLIDDITFSGTTEITDQNAKGNIVIYPNPCKEYLFVQNNSAPEYSVVDVTGKCIQKGSLRGDSRITLQRDLPAGLYYLELKNYSTVQRKSFVIN